MTASRLERTLETYIEALRDRPECAPALDLLRQEFLPGAATIARFGYVPVRDLFWGDAGIDLLHDVCEQLLAGGLGQTPKDGDLLRLVSRLAHARFRRHARHRDPATRGWLEQQPAPIEPRPASVPAGRFRSILSALADRDLYKRRGGVHVGRLATALDLPRKRLSSELRELGRSLGRGENETRFWIARLGECLVELLRARIERALPDLLPTRRGSTRIPPHQRLHRLLDRLTRTTICQSERDTIRRVRQMARRRTYPSDELHAAAEQLAPDPFPVHLARAEWLRAGGRIEAAEAVLRGLEQRRPASEDACLVPLARRTVLLSLAKARCLESRGDYRAASHELEPQASLHRRDALLAYNRLVLADAAGLARRVAAARSDLRQLSLEDGAISPLLRERIRSRLKSTGR